MGYWVEVGWSAVAGLFFSGWLIVAFKNYLHYIKTQTLQTFSLYVVYLVLKPVSIGLIFSFLNSKLYHWIYLDMNGYSLTYFNWANNVVTTLQLFLVGFMLALGIIIGLTYRNIVLLFSSLLAFISINYTLWNIVIGVVGLVLMVLYLFIHKPNIKDNVLTKFA